MLEGDVAMNMLIPGAECLATCLLRVIERSRPDRVNIAEEVAVGCHA